MQAENLVFNDSGERHVVEEVRQQRPHVHVSVLALALVVESVAAGGLAKCPSLHLSDGTTFVVAPKDCDSLWVADLEGDQQEDDLDRV